MPTAIITIKNQPPYDGEYDFDLDILNGEDLHTIKLISGVRAGELGEAYEAGDYDLLVAFTVIALTRAGKPADAKELRKWPMGAFMMSDKDEEVEEEVPPASASPTGSESSSGDENGPDVTSSASGGSSRPDGGRPVSVPSPTGPPGLETSVGFDPRILAS